MGKLETVSRERTKKLLVQKAILGSIATIGLLAMAAVAPNAIKALSMFGIGKRSTNPKYQMNKTFFSLIDQGYVKLEKTSKGSFARLTPKGKARLFLLQARELNERKPKRWDHKWRVLIFDIKEVRRGTRDRLRQSLRMVGFVRLQHSVWVYPYDCEDFIVLLKSDFHIGKELLYLIVDQIENDGALRKEFGIKA